MESAKQENNSVMNKIDVLSYFKTNLYLMYKPELILDIDKICDTYIKNAQKREEPAIREKNKKLVEAGLPEKDDFGVIYHSNMELLNEPKMEPFVNICSQSAYEILDSQGYDISGYTAFFTDFWVQEFSKNGGGSHRKHIQEDSHISGFYYLKCSENTSFPVFHDPKVGALQISLPEKNIQVATIASKAVHYEPTPGTFIFFNSYLPHEYLPVDGIDDFRFIHFNIQFIRNEILKAHTRSQKKIE